MTSASFVDALRLLGVASTESVAAVRAEIDRAIRRVAPAIDTVLVFDEEDGDLACVAATGSRVAYFLGVRIARRELHTLPARALANGHRALLGERGARGFHPRDAFAMAVPLRAHAGRTSVAYVASRTRIGAAMIDEIALLVDHAGFAYALAREREAHLERAEYDGLTGLLTPRALRERLGALIERARFAPRERIALLFIDTDHFKTWNDTYGHASGDALLRALARVLQHAAGPDDLAARNGGDEFCLVFTDTEKSRAIERADALRTAIAALDTTTLRHDAGATDVRITASIGVAAYPADVLSANGLLELADVAMYHCKRTGRDGVAFQDRSALVRYGAPCDSRSVSPQCHLDDRSG